MNISGTINSLRLLYNPSQFMPSLAISTFNDLPVPLHPQIKVVLLDKDNCFAVPHTNTVYPDYQKKWEALRAAYPGDQLMIVSNTSGSSSDRSGVLADELETATGVRVFRHGGKKPGCYEVVLEELKRKGLVKGGEEVAVVGDRLMTDVVMANLMGGYGVWIKDGVVGANNAFGVFEKWFYGMMKGEEKK